MQKYNSRQDVPDKYKWNLDDLFKNIDEYNKSFDEVKKEIDNISKYAGCTKDSNKLYEFLNYDIKLSALLMRVVIYAFLINDQELGISENSDRLGKAEELETMYASATAFFAPELLELPKEEYDKLFDNKDLLEFKSILDDIYRAKEHVIASDKEIIINNMINAAPSYENASQTLLNCLNDYGTVTIDGEEEKILQTNLRRLLKNDNKAIRKEVREKYYKVVNQYDTINAMLLNSYVKTCLTNSKMHNYKDDWDAKLFNNKVPNEAYTTLISTVEKHLDVYHKYFKMVKDTLKLDQLDMCDLSLELVKLDKEYSIEDAQELCLNAVKPLGEDYYNHFKKIFDEHYIDYACYPSKCSGGYSACGIDFNSRILMSYNYDLTSASIIAHEGGHNVHYQYVGENNPLQYRSLSTLISEVTSLTNECLLSLYLASNGKTKEERLKGVENILDVISNNLFDTVREGKMEQDFHKYVNEGNNITRDYMSELTKKSIDKYYGDIVNKDEYYGLSWVARSHYYVSYYLYDYAFCVSVATYVASEIVNGNKDMLDNYIKFLKTGSDKDIVDIFKVLGVDLTDEKIYERTIEYFDSMIDKFIELRDEVK